MTPPNAGMETAMLPSGENVAWCVTGGVLVVLFVAAGTGAAAGFAKRITPRRITIMMASAIEMILRSFINI
jgi:hypothetical protein